MEKRRAWLFSPSSALLAAALIIASATACNDSDTAADGSASGDGAGYQDGSGLADGSGGRDAPGDGTAGDGPSTDGSRGDGSGPATDGTTDRGGWQTTDGGPVHVIDGGVTITEDGGVTYTCYKTSCAGKILQCGDCVDNDNDGKVDWRDQECLGPCDNTEGPGLDPNVGGTTGTSCGVDCFFDYGNGPGNDQCVWDHRCDPLQPELPTCPYDKSLINGKKCPATQVATCAQKCLPYTPNGCDCFGCCTFPQLAGKGPSGGPGYVWIGAMDAKNNSTCTFADVNDPKKCPPCTPVPGCNNKCERCEVCIGKPVPPADCFVKPDAGVPPAGDGGGQGDGGGSATDGSPSTTDGGGTNTGQCKVGQDPCGLPGQAPCKPGYYCISGCCVGQIL